MTFPLPVLQSVSAANPWTYLVFAVIGFFFGYILESSGFGNSKKLAAQFYFTDLTVLKVMFTGIVVAMVLLFATIGLGIVDFNQIWVNPTYLSSGLLGGVIMGFGFIIGGFCPGTSVASAASGKIDGMLFLGGGFVGAFLFGETERFFSDWWNNSGYYGRVTLMDVFNVPAGVIVVAVILMALFMFWGAEQLEHYIGKRDLKKEPRWRKGAAFALFAGALAVLIIGVPSTEAKYARIADVKDTALANREVQIEPTELFHTLYDNKVRLTMIDTRPEADYNLFHIRGALNIPLDKIQAHIPELLAKAAPNAVYVAISNDETTSTAAWKVLVAESVPNTYLLAGGINNWIATFGEDDPSIVKNSAPVTVEQLQYLFPAALGDRYNCSYPDVTKYEELEYEPKIKLELKRDKSGGGCG